MTQLAEPEAGSKPELQPDYQRIHMLEQNIQDVHSYFNGDGKTRTKILLKHQFKKHYFILPPAWRILWRMRTAQQRMLPAFCSTGTIRSGTSSMSNYILQHPSVVLPLSKELGALSPRLNAVRAQFPTFKEADKVRAETGHATTGDFTPMLPGLTQLYWLKAVNPDVKVVITLRDPVERTLSHWRWNKMITQNFDSDPLWDAMPDMETCLRKEMTHFDNGGLGFLSFCGAANTGFVRQSCYLPFLKELYDNFPADRIHIIKSEDFFNAPLETAREVYQFLGLPDYEPVLLDEINPSPKVPVSDGLRDELREFFVPYNARLYDFLDRDLNW